MLGGKSSSSWFYPKPTGDPGQDRNASAVQFACLMLASAISTVIILNVIQRELEKTPLLIFDVAGLIAAMIMNRVGRWEWAARTAFLALLLTAFLLVFVARDGFRSLAMVLFPAMLLLCVMLLDRASYVITAGIILAAVATLGIAEKQGVTRAIPRVASSTTYESIFFVDLNLLVFAFIGSRIARDAQSKVFDLDVTAERLSAASLQFRQTAEALQGSEQQLVSIYNTVRDVIFHLAVEPEDRFRFVSVNAAFMSVTGLTREMVVGKTVNEVIPEPSLSMVLGKYRQAIEENTTVLWEETTDYPAGRLTGEVSVVPVFNDRKICTHLVGSVHDVTERKRVEAALRESEERLKNAERLAHVGSWRWDLQSDEVDWSEEMFHIFGQPQDYKPSYEGVLQAVVLQDRERIRREIRDALADHSGFSSEVQIARLSGDLRTITCIGEALPDEDGRPVSFLGACQDITDLRRAQRADLARQKLESVGTLASGIAHDFNNLLGSVLVQAEVALRGLASRSNPEGELKMIRDVALRGSEIVRELMIYAGKDSAVVELVNVSKIVKEMLELLNVSVSKHGVLEVNLGQNLPSVRANAAQLRQIVMNLVTNASDALGDKAGVIRLTTRYVKVAQDSDAILEGWEEGDYLQLEVSDTGCGITPETQAKMFDPFFTTKATGHGLGLAMVDGIVRTLGGRIRLTSQPGEGTTFQISLPCAENSAPGQSDAVSWIEDLGPAKHGTVLIVEDENPLRQAVTKMLRRNGFAVFEVGDGSSAIDLLRVNGGNIDLILLDVSIPGASSAQVFAEATKMRPDIRVILTSAYSQEMTASALSGPQISGFIRKPFQLGNLERTLRNALSMG